MRWDFIAISLFAFHQVSCFKPKHCPSRQCTTEWKRQERAERFLKGPQGLWGRVSSRSQGLCTFAISSGRPSLLHTAGRRPTVRERHVRWPAEVWRRKHQHSPAWLTCTKEADKKVTVKRRLGNVCPPFMRWMAFRKRSWPGMTNRSRIWADRLFAPGVTKSSITCVSFTVCHCDRLNKTFVSSSSTRACIPFRRSGEGSAALDCMLHLMLPWKMF